MGGKVEITREDGKRWLDRIQQAIDDVEGVLKDYNDLKTLDRWSDKIGFTQSGQDLKADFARRGAIKLQVYKDGAETLKKRYATVKAKLDAQFGADWESKVNIDKITDRIDQAGH